MPTSLYIGIDLGTTFTGVAYACPPSKTIHTIRRWPGSDNDEHKVPTRLFYDNKALLGWGFADPRNTVTSREFDWQTFRVVEGFKLEIDPSLDVHSGSTTKKQGTASETSRWYKDFLRSLYEHVETLMGRSYPQAWSQEVEFTFSVPNLYGPRIIAKFRDYLTDAGFGGGRHHVSTVSLTESQAAIVYASRSLAMFKNNDLVLVCDAGGGTTDCSLLRIVHEKGGRLQMEEVTPAFGMRIGSTDIDHAIREFYLSCLREHAWAEPILWPNYTIDCEIEDYKISFTTNTHAHLALHMTGYPEVQIDSLEIRKIFDNSVAGIVQVINTEMNLLSPTVMFEAENPYVVLCGGLGSSQYVRARMTELLSRSSAIPYACVIDIQDPQLVVAKGLVAERMWATADSRETWMEDMRKSPNRSKTHAETSDDRTGVSYLQYLNNPRVASLRNTLGTREEPYRATTEIADDGSDSIGDALERYRACKEERQHPLPAVPLPSFTSPKAGRISLSEEQGSSLVDQSLHGTEASSSRDRLRARLRPPVLSLPLDRRASSTLSGCPLHGLVPSSTGIPSDRTTFGIQTVHSGARISSSRSSESELQRREFRSTFDESQGFGDRITLLQLERLENSVAETTKSTIPYSERIVGWVENGSSPHGSGKVNRETENWLKRRHLNAGTEEKVQERVREEFNNDIADDGTASNDVFELYEAVDPSDRSDNDGLVAKRDDESDVDTEDCIDDRAMSMGGLMFSHAGGPPAIISSVKLEGASCTLDQEGTDADAVRRSSLKDLEINQEAVPVNTAPNITMRLQRVHLEKIEAARVCLSQTSLAESRSPLKSRKGCNTCKIRHLRCDEEFPRCAYCTKFHYFCDCEGQQPMRLVTGTALGVSDEDLPSYEAESSKVSSKPIVETKTPPPSKSIFCKRRCRVSYGVLKLELYDESKHLRQDVWRFPLNNKLYVENIIEWVIKQGEEIDDEWTAQFLCQKMLSNSKGDDKKYIFQTHLVTSNKKAHQLPKSMTQGGAETLCNIEADLSGFPLSEFEKHVHKLGMFKKSRIYYLVKYHVAASSSPADIIFEVLFRGKSAEHRVERRVLWHDLSEAAPATLTPDIGSLSLAAV